MTQRNDRRGFTLIELMVVIVILGIIATMGFVFFLDKPDEARWDTARTSMNEIVKALNDYSLSHDSEYPDTLDVLEEKHFPNGIPKDPFTKEDYLYETTDTGFTLTCLGKDLAEGGADKPNKDITYNEAGIVGEE